MDDARLSGKLWEVAAWLDADPYPSQSQDIVDRWRDDLVLAGVITPGSSG